MSDQISEVDLDEAWRMISDLPDAVLIDVRTVAEWTYVGRPDLSPVGKQARFVEWVSYPDGSPNHSFVSDATAGLDPDQPILLICRSGSRSRAAARALAEAGFSGAHNVTAGFEGNLDDRGQRPGGWKGAGLPWHQR